MKKNVLRSFALLLFSIIAAAGCGVSDYSSTEGVVKLDGVPLPNATVMFQAPNMPMAVAKTDDLGRYRVETGGASGMRPGEYEVTVAAYGVNAKGQPIRQLVTPEKYMRSETSGLKATISNGRNRGVDFELVSEGAADSGPRANEVGRMSSIQK